MFPEWFSPAVKSEKRRCFSSTSSQKHGGLSNQESQYFHVIFLNSAYNSFAYNQVNPTFGFIN